MYGKGLELLDRQRLKVSAAEVTTSTTSTAWRTTLNASSSSFFEVTRCEA